MIIVLKPKTTKAQINHIVKKIAGFKLRAQVSKGKERTIIAVIGDKGCCPRSLWKLFREWKK